MVLLAVAASGCCAGGKSAGRPDDLVTLIRGDARAAVEGLRLSTMG
jgi:hypothetical protein